MAHSYDAIAERYAAWTGESLTGARERYVRVLQEQTPPGAAVLDLTGGTVHDHHAGRGAVGERFAGDEFRR